MLDVLKFGVRTCQRKTIDNKQSGARANKIEKKYHKLLHRGEGGPTRLHESGHPFYTNTLPADQLCDSSVLATLVIIEHNQWSSLKFSLSDTLFH